MANVVSRERGAAKRDVNYPCATCDCRTRVRNGGETIALYFCPDYQIRAYLDMADDAWNWAHWYAMHGKQIAANMELLQVTRCMSNAIGWASR